MRYKLCEAVGYAKVIWEYQGDILKAFSKCLVIRETGVEQIEQVAS